MYFISTNHYFMIYYNSSAMMEDDQGASPPYNHQDDTGSTGTIDTRYIISKFGILKILEIVSGV